MATTSSNVARSEVRQFIPSVRMPSQRFLSGLSGEEVKSLERLVSEKAECVYQDKYCLARAEREYFGGRSTGCVADWPEGAAPVFADSQKIGAAGGGSHNADRERFMFERYNYARFRVTRILAASADKALTVKAARDLLKWGERAMHCRAEIIQINMPLVLSMAKRSRLDGLDFNEMISEGNMALIRSVEKFDPSRGFKFSTYGCRAILKSFSRVAMRASRYRGLFPVELTTELERSDFLERKRERIEDDCVAELRHILSANLAHLNEVEHTVIRERFALADPGQNERYKTLEQVGEIIGVTKERVRQIQNKALQKIKVALEETMVAA